MRPSALAFLLCTLLVHPASAPAQDPPGAPAVEAAPEPGGSPAASEPDPIAWQPGPGQASLGTRAEVSLADGYFFAGQGDTIKLLQAGGNPTSGNELGLIRPAEGGWFVIFEFDEVGYVKDDEKDKLDADKLLASIRSGNDAANEERKKQGWSTIEVVGWQTPPRYDPETQNLEWAIKGKSEDRYVINYNTRLLGRKGVMEASLVVDPDRLDATLPEFRGLLKAFRYREGERYSEFRQGDAIAKYGLAALVAGGAAAAAVKLGFFQKFFKFILLGLAAAAAALKGVIGRLFRGKNQGDAGRG